MRIKIKTNGNPAVDDRFELRQAEDGGVLTVAERIPEEVIMKHLESCSRNSQTAVVLDIRQRASPKIWLYAYSLKNYFELLKRCKSYCQTEPADPYFGVIVVDVDAYSAETIATELAAVESGECSAASPSDLNAVSLDTLAEWLQHVPIGPENYALMQLLHAGKIRDEHVWLDGRESVRFTLSGSIQEPPEVFRKLPSVESALLELFLEGEVGFHIATRNGKPAIAWFLINRCSALCQ
jgi:hypothetical protein